MKRFEIKLPDERFNALEAVAHKVGIATAAAAKMAIADWLDDRVAKLSAEHRSEAA
jgi:hypothetical protein